MKTWKALWYKVTAKYPRPLPRSDEEFKQMKEILIQAYGLEDHPSVWYTVASQLVSGPPTSLRRSYENIANAAKKLNIAALAQEQRTIAMQELDDRLMKKTEETIGAFKKEEEEKEIKATGEITPQWSDALGTTKTFPVHDYGIKSAAVRSGTPDLSPELPPMPPSAA